MARSSLLVLVAFILLPLAAVRAETSDVKHAMHLSHQLEIGPLIVTADGFGTHTTTAGVPVVLPGVSSLNADGVADLIINGSSRCTGTLLAGGTSLLTAGHCVSDGAGNVNPLTTFTATWHLSSGNIVAAATGANVTKHPLWNGNLNLGNDLAVITFASPVDPSVPRYDINRNTSEVAVGAPRIRVGYGRTGSGATGDTAASGTKRAGLNSHEVLGSDIGLFSNVLLSDFDNGLATNDAFGLLLGVTNPGFGNDEVNAAPGDSGGPTFFEANDTRLTLSAGSNLGSFLVGAVPAQSVNLTKDGTNSTTFGTTYSGDHANSNVASTAISDPNDVTDHKIAGVASFRARFNAGSPPDIDGTLNSSFGEIAGDGRVSAFQAFLDPFLGAGFTPLATQLVPLSIDDATAGAKSATVAVDNLATTSEFANSGVNDTNDSATFTATVLDHANGSFSTTLDANTLSINFGAVPQFGSVADIAFDVANLEAAVGFTARLDLDSITPAGDFNILTTNLSLFSNLDPTDSLPFLASFFDTSNVGSFSATYTLGLSDEDLPGAQSSSIVLTVTGQVVGNQDPIAVPEPSTLALLGLGLVSFAIKRRRAAK